MNGGGKFQGNKDVESRFIAAQPGKQQAARPTFREPCHNRFTLSRKVAAPIANCLPHAQPLE